MPSGKGDKLRLDQLLVQKGLAETREKAKRMIMAGMVEVERIRVDKPGHLIPVSSHISLKNPDTPYVSRGGSKLEAALDHFSVDVRGKVILDVGASTGGFTDCLLKYGARGVIAVDVGFGQLHWKLRQDRRVKILERTNVRYLGPDDIQEEIHGAVIDVSFISLRLVVPVVSRLLQSNAFILALIKPQFEVGKGKVGKGGVVRDPDLHREVIEGLCLFFQELGWTVEGVFTSPLRGPKGNKEFFTYMRRQK
jgi:23S rRNA (cytidine1920-2'-O)/16S rRNA (cytidine1409-2'-O)-methyltransferase